MTGWRRLLVLLAALAMPAAGIAQTVPDRFPEGSPLTRLPVYEAPFSAVAVTRANLRLPDGTRMNRRTTARYFRDTNGRVRIEHLMEGLPAPRTTSERHIRLLVLANPCEALRTLDPVSRTFRFVGNDLIASTTGADLRIPVGGTFFMGVARPSDVASGRAITPPGTLVDEETLGSRMIAGVEAVGRRVTMTTLAGQVGNDRPIAATDEWWYSPDLRLVMAADYTSTVLGTITYRVTQLRTDEPPDTLFTIPDDYDQDSTIATREDPWMSFVHVEAYVKFVRDRIRKDADRRP